MDELDMKSLNIVDENIEKIGSIFPNVIVESENGKAIDFELLKQELSKEIVEGNKEKYQITWPGKKDAILVANTPSTNTLRPLREKSVDFDNTENIYIEGDNLEALKILQESYLRKIKCIYIDPPYNTGNDFIYNDNFNKDSNIEMLQSGQIDENGNFLVTNSQSNGRFHSDWLSMMYPRLKLARNLLSSDGVIFISIDENEYANLKKLCDEIFGEKNYVGDVIRKTKSITNDSGTGFNNQHEYLLIYCKEINNVKIQGENKNLANYKNPDNDPNGEWCLGDPSARSGGKGTYFEIENPYTGRKDLPPTGRYWAFNYDTFREYVKKGKIKFKENYSSNERGFIFKRYKNELKTITLPLDSLFSTSNEYMNQVATKELSSMFDISEFSYPKPLIYIEKIINSITNENDIVLDFFSGSATTANAVLNLNSVDNKRRKFIMIQLLEKCQNNFDTICELGKERIRRSAKKIKEETNADIDYGFRVYKIDSSNMKDVYYKPNDLSQEQLELFESNIKEDRTSEDLLTQVILDLGLTLDLKIEEKEIMNNKVYFVDDNALIACFDNSIDINIVDEICEYNPLKVVFKDSSFKYDNDKINLEEKFKKLSPETEISIL